MSDPHTPPGDPHGQNPFTVPNSHGAAFPGGSDANRQERSDDYPSPVQPVEYTFDDVSKHQVDGTAAPQWSQQPEQWTAPVPQQPSMLSSEPRTGWEYPPQYQPQSPPLVMVPSPQPAKSGVARLWVIAIVSVLVLGGMTWGGFELFSSTDSDSSTAPKYASDEDGISVGHGPVVIDVYFDFSCPPCKTFDASYGESLEAYAESGNLTVIYHPMGMLDSQANDNYSTRAAVAALCASDERALPKYSALLFEKQPPEHTGLTNEELARLGTDGGLSNTFRNCVEGQKYKAWVTAATTSILKSVQSTPTVIVDGKKLADANDVAQYLSL